MRLGLALLMVLAVSLPAWAQNVGSGGGGGGTPLTVKENDNSPTVSNVNSISFTNGSVTDNGSGSVTVTISGTGAPTDATYITQTDNATLTNEQALGTLATGCMASTTTTGVVATRIITGTANQITVTNGNCTANPTISIPTNPTLPGTTTGTFSGNLTGDVTGNASGNAGTATALAADPADCSAGSATTGINAAGAAQGCTNYMEEPAGNGLVARTAANTSANRTITGTSNEISVTNGDGAAGNPTLSLPSSLVLTGKTLLIPNATTNPGTCTVGQIHFDTDATAGQNMYGCTATNTWTLLGDGGGGGSIGGSTGATDNAILRADGVGGATVQSSGCTISDANLLTCPGGFSAGSGTTGYIALLEGTAAGAGTNAGEHNLYFNSTNSLLQSHENGGSVVTYHSTANLPASLAANGANCSSGQFPLGVDASGASESCTALPTSIAGTANEIAASAATGAVTLSLPSTLNLSSKTVRIPNSTTLPATCTVGDMYQDTDATTGLRFYLCEATNSWVAQGSGGGTGLTSLASQTGNVQTITRGTGIGGSSATNDHSFTVDATELHALTWGDGTTSASWTWTYNLNAGTDPVITFNNGVVNVSTGALQEAGNDVFTTGSGEINAVTAKTTPTTSDLLLIEDAAATNAKKKSTVGEVLAAGDARTATLTNKTLDAEGTGNVLTIPRRIWFPAAGCNNATAGSVWDLPTSGAAVAACVTGTNTQKGVLDFADASNLSAQVTYKLPSTWTGNIGANIKWFSSTTTGDVVWQVATVCVADAETDDPAFNTASTVTDTTKGTTNQTNDAVITNVTATGCAAGELLHLKVFRDSAHASDTMAGTARLIGVELVVREAL